MLPNFIIAGATRSGTTSLYHYLIQHPEISFPKLKEPRYFSSYDLKLPQKGPGDITVDDKLITSFEEYNDLYFQINNKLVGDASSEYLYHHTSSVPKIKEKLGDIPIIFILRNPIERAYSAYNNLVRDGRETLNFRQALNAEKDRVDNRYDMMWHYTAVSKYHASIKHFLKEFKNVKIIIFEEFISNKESILRDIFLFLGVQNIPIDTSVVYSKSGKPKSKFIAYVLGRNNSIGSYIRNFLFKVFKREFLEKISRFFVNDKDSLPMEMKKHLYKDFEADIKNLEKLINVNLSSWKV